MAGVTTPIVALDVPTLAAALALADELDGLCGFYKVGLELFTAEGPRVVRTLLDRGADVFLDLKLHDIPNTVRGAVERAAAHGVRLVTVHASGGRAMLEAAQRGAGDSGAHCELLAVTVLTSLDAPALAAAWGRADGPAPLDVLAEVLRLAGDAAGAGLHGVVCGGPEAAAVRARFGGSLATLVPGVRLAGAGAQDQARVVTPAEAARAGASYVVLGRTVTAAADRRGALERVLAELRSVGAS
ncbi:MAG TPA: orotidine-5'-phosphate decarboxylase [Gemmatimonadaceae bacterium]|nr:orotidine-5'-phosphate decarboxylase [Gemmatimonadaceae bacterium]